MNFNYLIKKEFSRLFDNIAFKMEAEKLFIEGINEDKFFYIYNFEDGINCNLFNKSLDIEANINIFKTNQSDLKENKKIYNIKVILQKNITKYNLLFLIKKPIIKENTQKGVNIISDPKNLINKITNIKENLKNIPTGISIIDSINKLTNMFGGRFYPVKYSYITGGKIYSENELDNIIKRDLKRKKKIKKNKKIPKKEKNEEITKKCENFNNMYKDTNILRINVFDIAEQNLIENIFHIYYLILFNYILPNIYINFKNVNKIEKIDIDFNSLINKNNILKDSLDTIFFISKNENLYNKKLYIKDHLDKLPYQLDDIEVTIS